MMPSVRCEIQMREGHRGKQTKQRIAVEEEAIHLYCHTDTYIEEIIKKRELAFLH